MRPIPADASCDTRMNFDGSLGSAGDPIWRREETLQVAILLALAGGYIDAYTWIVHQTMANAQTANRVFLWVHATAVRWAMAFHYAPPILAFAAGVLLATLSGVQGADRERSQDRRLGLQLGDGDEQSATGNRRPVHGDVGRWGGQCISAALCLCRAVHRPSVPARRLAPL
jgi:hypothetical protein